ncbi:hypothetical protein PSAB6_50206 [Paraburkholderia sabiae]|nr:hypothetical protein PSAB6_50206 [Paraburkholderia sabiae]
MHGIMNLTRWLVRSGIADTRGPEPGAPGGPPDRCHASGETISLIRLSFDKPCPAGDVRHCVREKLAPRSRFACQA